MLVPVVIDPSLSPRPPSPPPPLDPAIALQPARGSKRTRHPSGSPSAVELRPRIVPVHSDAGALVGAAHPGLPRLPDPLLAQALDAALAPLRQEVVRLRARIQVLERQSLAASREITLLKARSSKTLHSAVAHIASKQRPQPSSDHPPTDPSLCPAAANPDARPLASHAQNPLDIPVGTLPGSFGVGAGASASQFAVAPNPDGSRASAALDAGPLGSASDGPPGSAPLRDGFSDPGNVSPFNPGGPFRRQASRRKSEYAASPSVAAANRAKHRKPELSRTVRATVFRLMGISSGHSPLTHALALPNELRFGNEKIRAYHGYTSSPCFPEYTSEELLDPETHAKLWRWDWSKTIRQSANNTNFAKEIRNVIVREAADPMRPMHTEVPVDDWQHLDDAIDSAYTNMRRERDNLLNPNKMVKKEVHRARNKKRGLKEDKYKRRKKAFEELRTNPKTCLARLEDSNLELTERPVATEEDLQNFALDPESYRWEDSLDLKYMSSEDEANVHDFENPIPVGIDRTDGSLAASEKVFAVCRPAWRSEQLQNFFCALDTIKQPERAYRRLLGHPRQCRPPPETAAWMIHGEWGPSSFTTATSQPPP